MLKLNPGPLKEQKVLLPSESSLQTHFYLIKGVYFQKLIKIKRHNFKTKKKTCKQLLLIQSFGGWYNLITIHYIQWEPLWFKIINSNLANINIKNNYKYKHLKHRKFIFQTMVSTVLKIWKAKIILETALFILLNSPKPTSNTDSACICSFVHSCTHSAKCRGWISGAVAARYVLYTCAATQDLPSSSWAGLKPKPRLRLSCLFSCSGLPHLSPWPPSPLALASLVANITGILSHLVLNMILYHLLCIIALETYRYKP